MRVGITGLAAAYARTIDQIERITGRTIATIHLVGGGVKNTLLNQMTADATGRRVLAGPSEATAMGNVMVQLMGIGEIADLAQARGIVRKSCQPTEYSPRREPGWERLVGRALETTR